jgi:transposase
VKVKRKAWQKQMKKFNVKNLVFIDESGVQNNMTRFYGRIIGGNRLREPVPGRNWDTTTMISSMRYDGSISAMTIEGTTDAVAFQTFISHVLCPTLRKNDIVVMDNLTSHKVSGIREAIEMTGAILLYLPPYSPDFNPIEMMWSKIKAFLRKTKARSPRALSKAISNAFKNITDSDMRGWFSACGYVLIQS